MKSGLKPGAEVTVAFHVEENHLAAFEGIVIHKVLSTVHLVYCAELAARKVIQPFLQDGEEAAGAGICISHTAPARIGEVVRITATLTGMKERELVCRIEGTAGDRIICSGTQTQVIVRKGSLD